MHFGKTGASTQVVQAWPAGRSLMGTTQGVDAATNRATSTFDRMVKRKLPLGLTFLAQDTWANMGSASNVRARYVGFIGLRSNIVVAVPLNMTGSTLAQVAAGNFDSYFTTMFTQIAADFPAAKIRLGWEFNGNYFAWCATGVETDFIAAWQHIYTLGKAISSQFEFCWNPDKIAAVYVGDGSADATACYPGDAYVDSIGIENYAQWRNSVDAPTSGSTFPYVTPEPTVKQVERWTNCSLGTLSTSFAGAGTPRPYCLLWAAQFATQHGKPLAIPEWGIGFDPLRNGRHVGDDAYHVAQTFAFITANSVAWHCYFDKSGESNTYNCRQSYSSSVTGIATGDPYDEKPLCAAAFQTALS
jgi:hypothetical protein